MKFWSGNLMKFWCPVTNNLVNSWFPRWWAGLQREKEYLVWFSCGSQSSKLCWKVYDPRKYKVCILPGLLLTSFVIFDRLLIFPSLLQPTSSSLPPPFLFLTFKISGKDSHLSKNFEIYGWKMCHIVPSCPFWQVFAEEFKDWIRAETDTLCLMCLFCIRTWQAGGVYCNSTGLSLAVFVNIIYCRHNQKLHSLLV